MSENKTLHEKIINAGAFADWIQEFHSDDVYWAVSALHNAPEIKAEPVVEALWEYDEENECFYCSHCGTSALNNYRGLSVESNRCPECGAHMKRKAIHHSTIEDRIQFVIKSAPETRDFASICHFAMRYAIGRKTYAPSTVIRFIVDNINRLNENEIFLMKKEVEDYGKMYGGAYGDSCDTTDWLNFKTFLEKELKKRNNSENKENKHE